MATGMLNNGADICYIQQRLGHSDLKSGQIYTELNNLALKAVHDKTHPARVKKTAEGDSKLKDAE